VDAEPPDGDSPELEPPVVDSTEPESRELEPPDSDRPDGGSPALDPPDAGSPGFAAPLALFLVEAADDRRSILAQPLPLK
jgi:hypothetical protein